MDDLALSIPCPYCGADRHQPCRQTMLDGRPVTETHKLRQEYAEGTPF
jgi:hypothetical protein